MYYWNQDHFEGLLAIADAADARGHPAFAEYCRLREGGLRARALAALRRFLEEQRGLGERERRAAATWVAEITLRNRDVHHLRVQPLWGEFVCPVLERWAEEADGHLPRRLLALLWREEDRLLAVLAHDPSDHAARAALMEALLYVVDDAGHHLSEGLFSGPESEAEALLRKSQEHIAALPASPPRDALQSRHDALLRLLSDWLEFKGTGIDRHRFREWCAERGRDHGWYSVHYFKP
jgi:hypothetical protein